MTQSKRINIKDKVLELREKTLKQRQDYEQGSELKKRRYQNILNSNEMLSNPILAINGATAMFAVLQVLEKATSKSNLEDILKEEKLFKDNQELAEKFAKELTERLEIIEKAEKHDLEDFINKNDIYAVFEDDKLKKFLEKAEDKNHSKEQNNIVNNKKDITHEQ
ncbi:hypothetical protein FE246_07195 [Aliarcobacter thereius]|uniref:Uncharacterized protein n=1 Tax=Aliarcobacter thereius TaxID=544718 RepID=A0A5R9H271_9BACT|nr:hypothetical protein [Aliarcobacter thereius]TLS71390.1 hypothetical protein FE246_07195 [Aliarcobacter thereius]